MDKPSRTTDDYLEDVRAQVPLYDQLQDAAVAAIPFAPETVLELGIGTGQTSKRLLERFPGARITGLDSDPDMIFRARDLVEDVSLARMEDPLPDGPWDLVVCVLSAHRLTHVQREALCRRVRQHSRSFVLGDFVALETGEGRTQVEGTAYPETARGLAEWSGGEIAWQGDDLVVVAADYRE